MKLHDRGFFSIDAMFALTLLLMISTSFLTLSEGREQVGRLTGARLGAKLVGEELATVINTVYANGANFELRVNLPGSIGGYSYRITFDNTARQISVDNSAWGVVEVGVACGNVRDFVLDPENLQNTLRVHWAENQVRIVSL